MINRFAEELRKLADEIDAAARVVSAHDSYARECRLKAEIYREIAHVADGTSTSFSDAEKSADDHGLVGGPQMLEGGS